MDEIYHLFLNHTAVVQLEQQVASFIQDDELSEVSLVSEGSIEAYCLAPNEDESDGSFTFAFVRHVDFSVPTLWHGPVKRMPVDFHEGLRAICFAAATPRFPQEIRTIVQLCFGAGRGDARSIKNLFDLGLDTDLFEYYRWSLTPAAKKLDAYRIAHNLGPSFPRTKRR